jgi:hypothetical protein
LSGVLRKEVIGMRIRLLLLLALFTVAVLLPGCITLPLLKKKCDSSACIQTAFRNNCEEAYYQGSLLGYDYKSDVSRDGNKCRVTDDVSGQGGIKTHAVCYYDMPVGSNMFGNCTRT